MNSMNWMRREGYYKTIWAGVWVGDKCCIDHYGINHNKVLEQSGDSDGNSVVNLKELYKCG